MTMGAMASPRCRDAAAKHAPQIGRFATFSTLRDILHALAGAQHVSAIHGKARTSAKWRTTGAGHCDIRARTMAGASREAPRIIGYGEHSSGSHSCDGSTFLRSGNARSIDQVSC